MKNRRGWVIASAVIAAALLGACSYTPGTTDGRVIYLTVGGPSDGRLISTETYGVESLNLAIYDPEENLLWSETWEEGDGVCTYTVEVGMLGTHEIVVVHNLEEGADPAEVEEREFFDISCMMVTFINITPGAIGVVIVDDETSCPLVGAWEGSIPFPEIGDSEPVGGVSYFLVELYFHEDGTAELNSWETQADKDAGLYLDDLMKYGSYEFEPDEIIGLWTHEPETLDPLVWVEMDGVINWGGGNVTFSGDCDTLSFSLIIEGEDTGLVWELTRM